MLDNSCGCEEESLIVLNQASVYTSITKDALFMETKEWS